jgi:hypothetical protein
MPVEVGDDHPCASRCRSDVSGRQLGVGMAGPAEEVSDQPHTLLSCLPHWPLGVSHVAGFLPTRRRRVAAPTPPPRQQGCNRAWTGHRGGVGAFGERSPSSWKLTATSRHARVHTARDWSRPLCPGLSGGSRLGPLPLSSACRFARAGRGDITSSPMTKERRAAKAPTWRVAVWLVLWYW